MNQLWNTPLKDLTAGQYVWLLTGLYGVLIVYRECVKIGQKFFDHRQRVQAMRRAVEARRVADRNFFDMRP